MKRRDASPRGVSTQLVVRSAWGVVLLAAPGVVLAVVGDASASRAARRVCRLLGIRHLLQSAGEFAAGPLARRPAAAVDTLHGLSCLVFAASDVRWRRAAIGDAFIAAAFARSDLRYN